MEEQISDDEFELKGKKKKRRTSKLPDDSVARPARSKAAPDDSDSDSDSDSDNDVINSTDELIIPAAQILDDFPKGDEDYSYKYMTSRLFKMLGKALDNEKFILPLPILVREGTKKTIWTNFGETCSSINRDTSHVMKFFSSELVQPISTNPEQHLIVKMRLQQKQVENLLKHYIDIYVRCKSCKGHNTRLEYQQRHREHMVICDKCSAEIVVEKIKNGFRAAVSHSKK